MSTSSRGYVQHGGIGGFPQHERRVGVGDHLAGQPDDDAAGCGVMVMG